MKIYSPLLLGNASSSGHIVPSSDETYDLGSSTLKFKDLYLSGSTIYLGTIQLKDVGGTLQIQDTENSTIAISADSLPSGTVSHSAQIDHDQTINFNADEHFSQSSITTVGTVTAGSVTAILPSGTVSSSAFSSPSQGTVRATINGVQTDVDTGLQSGDSPTFTNLTLSGNLTVNGSTTYISSSQLDIGDRIVTLNANSAAGDGGLYVNDTSTAETGSLLWDVSENYWMAGLVGSESEVMTLSSINTKGVVSSSAQIDITATTGTLTVAQGGTGATSLTSNSILTGNGTSAITAESNLTFDGSTLALTGDLNVGSGDFFVDDSTGNVGIGTSSPANLLHVSQASANTTMRIGNNSTYDQFIYFNGNTDWSIGMDYSNSNAFTISNSSALGTNGRMVIDTAGRVGIGTTGPSHKLTVRNDVSAITDLDPTAIKLYNNSDGGSAIEFSNGVSGNSKISFGVESSGGGTDDTYIGFSTSVNAGTASEKMRITSGGNVGIGTTPSSGVELHVHDSAGNASIRMSGAAANNETYQIQQGIDGVSNGGFAIRDVTNSVNRFVIQYSTGNVGIGTTTPGQKLEVSGIIYATTDVRAPIFYDSNNTGYYVDAASTSNFALTVGGGTVWHTANDGAGSGLDADLLDGVQGASYLRSDVDDTFTRLSGARVSCGFDSGNDNSIGCSNWFYSSGAATGWYNTTYTGGIYMVDSTWVRVYNNKQFYSQNLIVHDADVRAPIFYDSNNTGYYVDPASTSNLNVLTAVNFRDGTGAFNVNLGSGGAEGRGLVAGYSGGSYGGIGYNVRHTTTGGTYTIPLADTSNYLLFNQGFTFLGTATGAAGRSTTYTTLATLNNSGVLSATTGDMRAPLFYDYDNTNYYVDPAGSSVMTDIYSYGWFRTYNNNGLYNQTHANHWYATSAAYWNLAGSGTSEAGILFRTGGHQGTIRGYVYADSSNNIGFLNSGGSWRAYVSAGNDFVAVTATYSPIFYDLNSSGWYVDPAGTSIINTYRAGGNDAPTWGTNALNGNMDFYYFTATSGAGISHWASFIGGSKNLRAYIMVNGGFANYQGNDFSLSDERLKTDIVDCENYLDKLCLLEVKKFRFKDQGEDPSDINYDSDLTIGLIAQQVREIAPEFITTDWVESPPEGEEPYMSLYNQDIHFAMLKAIQELKAKIDDLESRLNG